MTTTSQTHTGSGKDRHGHRFLLIGEKTVSPSR